MKLTILETTGLSLEGYAVTVSESFKHSFMTKRGTIIANYDYGTEFYKLKHRNFDNSFLIDFKRCCKDACEWDDRLEFISVDVDTSKLDTGILNFIVNLVNYVIEGSLNV